MNVRIAELIFMEKDEREFSLMSKAHECIVFETVRHSKTLLAVVFFYRRRASMENFRSLLQALLVICCNEASK